jgi:lysophospholipase L1-like esterase
MDGGSIPPGSTIWAGPLLWGTIPSRKTKDKRAIADTRYDIRGQYRDVFVKITAILLTTTLASGCGGGSQMAQERQITPSASPEFRAPTAPISNVAAFMGDSITLLWDLAAYDSSPTINLGISGQTTIQMLARFDAVISAAPGVVVILGGINDFDLLGPAVTNIDSIKAMAGQAQAAGIRVILCSVMPQAKAFPGAGASLTLADIEAFNQQLIELARTNGYLYADYYDQFVTTDGQVDTSLLIDGLHPNAAGYAKMWAVIAPLLAEDLN